jgi:hypothetical protein
MPSAKYIGYLGGAAVAAGVGAAIAVAGPGTAHADTDGTSSSARSSSSSESDSSESKATTRDTADTTNKTETETETAETDAGPERTTTNHRPKFDPAEAVRELTKQFGLAKPPKTADDTDEVAEDDEAAEDDATVEEPTEVAEPPVDEDEPVAAAPLPVFQPVSDLATKASEAVAALTKPWTPTAPAAADTDTDTDDVEEAAGPVPWSINPFRPMPPEPAPNDMPGALWDVEQTVINAFAPVPFLQPFVREGFEAAFRGSQFIPFVNAVIPAVNIIGQLPNLASGDPVVFRAATQSIINNLIVTLHPVSVLYYGYDEVADFINLEYEAQQLKDLFYATTWDILDPFALLHNRGQSGLPLSPSSPGAIVQAPSTPSVQLAAAVADAPSTDPFRADDPDPIGMPAPLMQVRDLTMLLLPSPLKEVYREGFELVYRASQVVPVVNMVVPVTAVLPAVVQALRGDKVGAQIAINQLLLTTGPVSVLYYGYDQIADLLNTEEASFAAKEQFYINLWDAVDPNFILHNQGQSGLLSA